MVASAVSWMRSTRLFHCCATGVSFVGRMAALSAVVYLSWMASSYVSRSRAI
ncbi:hypothetical protein PF003_g8988 [Phytophthora fragariae]|nr:hypothetical protein PF003_g8988 [Phytophthora fragariae]